ncbi:aldo-keto reductase [Saccharata proteae CBS 121410]|uniref:Aldo-keto reductase n=1 Tax=Saccharata proteae CBS 121410 TaxID=1314787 RepID=A0A6A5YCJ7_9PEZI|nr:aldo-keto reductase [Saccharata proteae CBS 121410]
MEYVRLGNSGLKISKVILGAMSYGSREWQDWVLNEDEALPLLKHAYDCGINTWDTADIYSHGRSEALIGRALKEYAIPRERVVILTKCFFGVSDDGTQPSILSSGTNDGATFVNRVGLSRKHILDAVDGSVSRLGTYIDVLQIHRLDRETPKEEIMRALNDVVESGKVRYIGASSMAAWEFQMLNAIAARHGWHQFVSMQPYYNLLYREEEREMFPYCRAAGIGVIPWSPIARGLLTRPLPAKSSVREATDSFLKALIKSRETAADREIIARVERVAKNLGVSMAAVATSWVVGKGCCPILGLSSKERIEEAVENARLVLGDEETRFLEEAYVPKEVVGY